MSVMVYNLGFVFFLLIGTIVALAMPGTKPVSSDEAVLKTLLDSYGKDQGAAVSLFLINFIKLF